MAIVNKQIYIGFTQINIENHFFIFFINRACINAIQPNYRPLKTYYRRSVVQLKFSFKVCLFANMYIFHQMSIAIARLLHRVDLITDAIFELCILHKLLNVLKDNCFHFPFLN